MFSQLWAVDNFLEYMHDTEEEAAMATVTGELLTVTGEVAEEILREAVRGYDMLSMSCPFTQGLEMMRDTVAKMTKNPPCDILVGAEPKQ